MSFLAAELELVDDDVQPAFEFVARFFDRSGVSESEGFVQVHAGGVGGVDQSK